jgi:hypothetical protein
MAIRIFIGRLYIKCDTDGFGSNIYISPLHNVAISALRAFEVLILKAKLPRSP